jgi:hypothetical protein
MYRSPCSDEECALCSPERDGAKSDTDVDKTSSDNEGNKEDEDYGDGDENDEKQ